MQTLDQLTRELTMARSFSDLVHNTDCDPSYRPSLLCFGNGARKARVLADAYDAEQQRRGCGLRAFRG